MVQFHQELNIRTFAVVIHFPISALEVELSSVCSAETLSMTTYFGSATFINLITHDAILAMIEQLADTAATTNWLRGVK